MSVATLTSLERIEQRVDSIKGGTHKVMPGQPLNFSEASVPGDILAQGDLYLMIYDGQIPADYVEIKNPKEVDKQLVPGNTEGSKHCLEHLNGVTMYRPKVWNGEDLRGPLLVFKVENRILHRNEENGGHGTISGLKGFTILCGYQPEYMAEQKRERRNAD